MNKYMKEIIDRGYEINYKMLYFNKMKVFGKEKYQVHCNYGPLEFSEFYNMNEFDKAARQFLRIRKEYA